MMPIQVNISASLKWLSSTFSLGGRLTRHDFFPIFAFAPMVGFYLIDPKMFELEWVGYAIFVFAFFFLFLCWLIPRLSTKPTSRIRWFWVISAVVGMFLYQYLVYGVGFIDSILNVGAGFGLRDGWLHNNWRVSIDAIFFTIYIIGLLVSFFGFKALKKFLAPIAYCVLTVVSFLLDALFPMASFTAFQVFIPFLVMIVAFIVSLTGAEVTHHTISNSTGLHPIILIQEPRGLALEVNWPCAGIFSTLIYFVVMWAFLQVSDVKRSRKLVYLVIGFFGTLFVNVLRIVALIVAYVFFNADLIVFHNYIGAVFFVIWITSFLSLIVLIERKYPSSSYTTQARVNSNFGMKSR